MPCSLQRDLSFACDFKGTAGSAVNILVRGAAPATIFRAELNGAALPLSTDRTRTSFNITAGGCALLIQVTAAPADTVDILEDCGGSEHVLRSASAVDPIKRITICA